VTQRTNLRLKRLTVGLSIDEVLAWSPRISAQGLLHLLFQPNSPATGARQIVLRGIRDCAPRQQLLSL